MFIVVQLKSFEIIGQKVICCGIIESNNSDMIYIWYIDREWNQDIVTNN